jgi:hypothetical protein
MKVFKKIKGWIMKVWRKRERDRKGNDMAFFQSSVQVLETLVIALGAGLGVWGVINLLEGYGNDNPGAKSQGIKHVIPDLLEQ